jgi:hypothetical protein
MFCAVAAIVVATISWEIRNVWSGRLGTRTHPPAARSHHEV